MRFRHTRNAEDFQEPTRALVVVVDNCLRGLHEPTAIAQLAVDGMFLRMNAQRELADLVSAFGDRYRIERELGRGGMGAVYLARDLRLDRNVAIKVLPAELANDSQLRERFLRETRIAASFSHPNIVPVYAVEERPGLLAFVMGYVEGESLTQRVRRAGPLEAREILRLLLDIGYALSYAHGNGVIHRDVKPDNIMLERATGRALLMDFGISRSVAPDQAAAGMTRVGEVVGTPEYMSPEQSVGDVLDGRSDLYSLALTAFFAATGRAVFEGDTTQKILMRQLSEAPPPLATLRPDLPAVLADAVDRCLAKDPAERFDDAATLASALEAAQSFTPDVPMPIRLFTQEVATLGMVMFFAAIIVWLLAVSNSGMQDDIFIPIVLLAAIFLGRILQTFVEARRLVRQGFPAQEIRRGMNAVVDERESRRVQLRNDSVVQKARRRTVIMSLAMIAMSVWLFYSALEFRHRNATDTGWYIELPGTIMFMSALILVGIGISLLMRSPLRMPISERVFRLVWLGPVGGLFFSLASRGNSQVTGSTRITAPFVRSNSSAIRSATAKTAVKSSAAAPLPTSTNGSHTPSTEHLIAIETRLANIEAILRQTSRQ